uniref:MADS-box domain-containing protein n=1 Tax=Tetradesmus obliquus TaxID=3088 RepID=A0A383VN75_TETOB|eukprot:jgi/Sobl393_1/11559/SZX66977.1
MARYEREDMCPDDDDSEDEMGPAQHKAKPRRKSHQRPQGSDQIRQAFSKRKKGLVLKAYQLNALTDAKVFMFITNDKGTSWAYATPGFSSSLDADLLKQLRSLAHVPESAKLITEVMPDPPNAKQPADTAAADEHAAPHRADQVPVGVPPMRAAAGNGPARSRSSYSGDGAPAGACNDRVPLARSGSTTTNTRAQSLAQSEELPHTKQQHARPPSGSSMAGDARPNSAAAAAHNQYVQQQQQQQQQQQRAQGGKLLGMEPPTPCGMYNLMNQPAVANDSPTVVSDMAASCASPSSSKQQMLPPDVAAGVRLAAVVNAAAASGMPIAISQGGDEGWQQQQQQQQPASLQWMQQQELQQQANYNWQQYAYQQQQQYSQQQQQQQYAQQQQQQQYQQTADGWVAVEVSNQRCYGTAAGNDEDSKLQLHVCSTGYPGSGNGNAAAMWPPALQQAAANQQLLQPTHVLSSSAPNSTAGCSFEHMMRGLPPVRTKSQAAAAAAADWRDADGAHSAPAGPAGASGRPSQWIEFESKPDNLRQMSDTGCYASSSGYSSYGASPSCNANAQRASTSSPIDGQAASPAVAAAGSGPSSAAASMLLAREAASADPSPTAALSSQLCSLLAMDSPMHEGPVPADQQQQQQLGGWQEQGRGAEASAQQGASMHDASNQQQQQQQQQQQHNQGAYIPRTDDLVSDPLMEMLMDQAMAGGSHSRPGSSGGQHHQHMSIMEATLQQEQQQQQQPAMQVPYYGSNAQQQQQQQQLGQYGQPQYRQQPQVQHSMPIPISRGAQQQQQQQQPEQQQQLLQLSGLLQHFPLPPKSDADKPAWQEHVRQVLLSLQLQPQQQQQLMALIRDREQQALLARGCGTASGCSGSTTCSPVLPPGSCSNTGMMMLPPQQQQQQQQAMMGQSAGGNVPGVNYLPRGPGIVCMQGGGKQRHGPSRLSATSPAIDAAAAAGMDAPGMPSNMQGMQGSILGYVGQSGQSGTGSMAMYQHQQQMGGGEAAAMPANCMSMSVPVLVPMSMAAAMSAGYCVQQGMQQQVCSSGGMAAAAGGYGCMPQVMAMPVSSNAMMGMQPSISFEQQQQQGAASGMAAAAANPHLFATHHSRQASPAASDPGPPDAAAASPAHASLQQQHPASSAPGSLLADLQQQQQQQRTGMAACSSPLKRSQPCSGPFGLAASSAAAFIEAGAEAMSPLKRACRELPEPPSFATLLQTELGEDDAVAWAASAAANDSVKMAGNLQPCDSFLKFDSLGKVGSGSLPTFVTVGGGEAAAAQMAAAYAAAAAAGEGEGAGDGAAAAGGGCDDDAEDDGSMLQAVLAQAVDEGDCDGGCVLDDCDTEMGDVAAGSAAAVAPPAAGDAAAAAAADELQQCAVVDGGVAAQGAM